jgi:hypothetical protein
MLAANTEALEAEIARREAKAAKKGRTWEPFNKNNEPLSIPVDVLTTNPDGFGPGQRVVTGTSDVDDAPILDANGQRQAVAKTNAQTQAHIVWQWVPNPPPLVGGDWRPITYYPKD